MPAHKDQEETSSSDIGRPFSEDERKALREMLESSERMKWLRKAISGWAGWTSLTITAILVSWDSIKKIIKAAVGL